MKPITQITVAEAAQRLGKSEPWVRALIADGRIKAERIGARVLLIDPKSLQAVQQLPMGRRRKLKDNKVKTEQ
jgi:excisionase family DNA binding protein